ncbi:MAG: hypothetical protein MRK02_12890 [Candidatus Scalindua sp.]|nr:hypothetical protein [Candidatus Scalindua sp.]
MRLVDSLDTAYRLGHGYLQILFLMAPGQSQPNKHNSTIIRQIPYKSSLIDNVEWTELSFSSFFVVMAAIENLRLQHLTCFLLITRSVPVRDARDLDIPLILILIW